MSRIIKTVNQEVRQADGEALPGAGHRHPHLRADARSRDRSPRPSQARLKGVGLWDVNPANLFRITWKNDPETGPLRRPQLPGDPPGDHRRQGPRSSAWSGKYFPTGAHKVGAAFACLVPRLVSGEFDPEKHKAVWPSHRQLLPRRRLRLARCWAARPWPSCPRTCPRSASPGSARSAPRSSPPRAASPTSRRSTTSAGS